MLKISGCLRSVVKWYHGGLQNRNRGFDSFRTCMQKAFEFIKSQKLMVLACHDSHEIWVANVYYGVDEQGIIYFISPDKSKHSQMILKNPHVAFSIAWFDQNNHKNRKAIQGLGECRLAQNEQEIATGVSLHNQNIPEFKDQITVDWIKNNEWGSKVWLVKPTYIKYWDDELYGDKETQEFNLS